MQHTEATPLAACLQQNRVFPIRTLRVFGGIQIGLGVVAGVLSVIGMVLDGINMNKYCDYGPYYDYSRCSVIWDAPTLFAFDITCLIFSGWFILTGTFPFCMTEKRQNSWRCLKITFMVCCIIGASTFIPTVFSLGVVGAIMRGNDNTGAIAVLPSFVALIGLAELIVAIVASSYCCCCSKWSTSERIRTVYITTNQPGMVSNMPNSQILNPQQIPNVMTHVQTGLYPVGITAQQYQVATSTIQGDSQPPAYKQQA